MFSFVLTLKGLQKFLDWFKFTNCASNLAFCSCITLNNNLCFPYFSNFCSDYCMGQRLLSSYEIQFNFWNNGINGNCTLVIIYHNLLQCYTPCTLTTLESCWLRELSHSILSYFEHWQIPFKLKETWKC